jgi:hypothetical protein
MANEMIKEFTNLEYVLYSDRFDHRYLMPTLFGVLMRSDINLCSKCIKRLSGRGFSIVVDDGEFIHLRLRNYRQKVKICDQCFVNHHHNYSYSRFCGHQKLSGEK